jgi:hypothetical protein
MQAMLSFSHGTCQSSHMLHEGQGKMAYIFDGQCDQTMPCKELQVLECPDVELEHYQMRMPAEHYQCAKEHQALICW